MLLSCKAEDHHDEVGSSPGSAASGVAADARAAVAADAAIDAVADAASDAMPEREALALRLRSYVELLSIDFWVYQDLEAFPGAPPGTTFVAISFSWEMPPVMRNGDMQAKVVAIVQAANRPPRAPVDEVVQPYAQALATWLPRLLDLQHYYEDSRFVDDEFDRARKEAADVARARRELAALRVPMRSAVLRAWRELSADVPDSPRAIVGAAWEACIRFADHLMAGDPPKALSAAVSACRRAIPAVTALPAGNGRELADALRGAAIAIGDRMANEDMKRYPPGALAQLTAAYLDAWPKLSMAPAERAPP